MLQISKFFDKWWDKTQKTVATPLVFNCYRAGYINAVKHAIFILILVLGIIYVVT